MKHSLFFICISLFLPCLLLAQEQFESTAFDGGIFEIKFPSKSLPAEIYEHVIPTTDSIKVSTWTVYSEKENKYTWFFSQFKVPEDLKTAITLDSNARISFFLSTLLKSSQLQGGYEHTFKEIEYENKYKGFESSSTNKWAGGVIRGRIYIIEDYIYSISVVGKKISSRKINKTMNSFRIVN